MADIGAIRQGLADRLATLTGLRAFAYIPDAVPVPAAVVGPPEVDFDRTFQRGADTLRFPIRVYASRADVRTAQAKLDSFFETGIGEQHLIDHAGVYIVDDAGDRIITDVLASSVKSVLEAEQTLGGAAMVVRVLRASGYGVYDLAGVPVLGAEWTVEVVAEGAT